MDAALRELERAFFADPDDAGALRALRQAYARLGQSVPLAVLRATPRWRPLTEFVARWYEEPLGDGDGVSDAELDAAEAKLEGRLPLALREWHRLVGKRLHSVQDAPSTVEWLGSPDPESDEPARASVWGENQGCWSLDVDLDGDAEDPRPVLLLDGDEPTPAPEPLVRTLQACVLSDTLVGAWAGRRQGPLGRLAPSVAGGAMVEVGPDVLAAARAHYQTHPFDAPMFEEKIGCQGDADTVVVLGERSLAQWMTATDAARRQLCDRFGLDAPGKPRTLIVHVTRARPKLDEEVKRQVRHARAHGTLIQNGRMKLSRSRRSTPTPRGRRCARRSGPRSSPARRPRITPKA